MSKFPPVTASNSRMSLGPSAHRSTSTKKKTATASATASAAPRKSIGGIDRRQSYAPTSSASQQQLNHHRQSLAPSSSSSSTASSRRQSLAAPSSSRQSLAPSTSRSSLGRQSLGGGNTRGSTIRQEPRPLNSKEWLRESIKKLTVFLVAHGYPYPLSEKLLLSPSTKDFKNILTFLFTKFDPNFKFNDAQFEEQVKFYIKKFGYPFGISKSALQAVGSKHSWPGFLGLLVWIQEFLQYYEEVHGNAAKGANSNVDIFQSEKLFYQYAIESYHTFLQYEPPVDPDKEDEPEPDEKQFNAAITAKFESINTQVSDDVESNKQRAATTEMEIERLEEKRQKVVEIHAAMTATKADISTIEDSILKVRAHTNEYLAQIPGLQKWLEVNAPKIVQLKAEEQELNEFKDSQPFTTYQVQEMLNQRSTYKITIEAQETQLNTAQTTCFKHEMECATEVSELENLISEWNELDLEAANLSSLIDRSYLHDEVQFDSTKETVDAMLNIDMKNNKKAITGMKDYVRDLRLGPLKQEMNQKEMVIAKISQEESDLQDQVNYHKEELLLLEDHWNQACKREVAFEKEARANVMKVELEMINLRNSLACCLETVPTTALQAMDTEVVRQEKFYLDEESALKSEICTMMQELTEHKVAIQERLEAMIEQAEAIKQEIAQTEIKA